MRWLHRHRMLATIEPPGVLLGVERWAGDWRFYVQVWRAVFRFTWIEGDDDLT